MRRRAHWFCLFACVLGAACSSADRTGLVVLVEDCAGVASDLTRVTVRVRSNAGSQVVQDFELGPAGVSLPFSFGIAPGDGGKDAVLTVIVEGYKDSDGSPAVVYTATDTGFVDGELLLLDVCLDRTRTESRPPSTLERVARGDELMRDAGGGMDANLPTDASMDGSVPSDAGMDGDFPTDAAADGGFPTDAGMDGAVSSDAGAEGGARDGSMDATADADAAPDAAPTPDAAIDAAADGGAPDCGTSCEGATAISAPGGRFTVTVSGSSEHTGSCGGAGPEQAFTLELDETSDVFLTTHGSGVDTILYVRSCHCNGPTEACNDDADGQTTSAAQLNDLPAGTYTVFVDTKVAMSAELQLDAYIGPPASAGDGCSRPRPFDEATEGGNTCGGTSANDSSGCDFTDDFAGPDHVYYFVVDSTSTVSFDTCAGCTVYDSSLDLRSVCDFTDGSTRIACGGDNCESECDEVSSPPNNDRQSRLETTLGPGLYYLVIDGWGFDSRYNCGDYEIVSGGLGL